MSKQKKNTKTEFDMQDFGASVDELVKLCERLQIENTRLRNEAMRLKAEHREMSKKNDLSKNKMSAIITRLKTMEIEI